MKTVELADEFRVVAAAVRATIGGVTPWLLDHPPAGLNWPTVLSVAVAHRSLSLVHSGLAGQPFVPPEIRQRLFGLTQRNAQKNLALVATTARLWRLLDAAGIRCLVLKGVALSQRLYGDPTRRGAGDVDLLVDPQRLWQADQVLRCAGCQATGTQPADGPARLLITPHLRDLNYLDPSGFPVELHQRLTANAHRLPVDFDTLWAERSETVIGGIRLPTLPERILPLYLCVHGAHHCWERLCWLADMAVLLRDEPAAATAMADAERAGLGAAMRLALALAHAVLGVPEAAPPSADTAAAHRFLSDFFAGSMGLRPPERGTWVWFKREMRRRRYLYSLKPNWRHKWQELQAELSNPVDLDVLPLGPRWVKLYPVLRPLGWVRRNFSRK